MLGPTVTAPNSTKQAVFLDKLEVSRVATPPHLLATEQRCDDHSNGGEYSQDGVVPCEIIQAKEEARDTTGRRFRADLGRVLRDFADSFED